VSRSSARLRRNCSCANTSPHTNRRGGASSHFLRAGTTYVACIAALAIAHRSNSKTSIRKIRRHRRAGCPPSGSVMVETGDPPPARGQPAIQRYKEDQSHIELNCKSIRRIGSTSVSSFSEDATVDAPATGGPAGGGASREQSRIASRIREIVRHRGVHYEPSGPVDVSEQFVVEIDEGDL